MSGAYILRWRLVREDVVATQRSPTWRTAEEESSALRQQEGLHAASARGRVRKACWGGVREGLEEFVGSLGEEGERGPMLEMKLDGGRSTGIRTGIRKGHHW